jgi:hypothetical protein
MTKSVANMMKQDKRLNQGEFHLDFHPADKVLTLETLVIYLDRAEISSQLYLAAAEASTDLIYKPKPQFHSKIQFTVLN